MSTFVYVCVRVLFSVFSAVEQWQHRYPLHINAHCRHRDWIACALQSPLYNWSIRIARRECGSNECIIAVNNLWNTCCSCCMDGRDRMAAQKTRAKKKMIGNRKIKWFRYRRGMGCVCWVVPMHVYIENTFRSHQMAVPVGAFRTRLYSAQFAIQRVFVRFDRNPFVCNIHFRTHTHTCSTHRRRMGERKKHRQRWSDEKSDENKQITATNNRWIERK